MDNEAHIDIGNRFGVEGYPTVRVFRSDKGSNYSVKYTGSRTVEGLVEFLMEEVHDYVGTRAKDEVSF